VGTPARGQVHAANAVGARAVGAHAGGTTLATPPRARPAASTATGGAEPLSRPINANHITTGDHATAGDHATMGGHATMGDKEDNHDSREDVADRRKRTMPATIDRWVGAGQGCHGICGRAGLPVDNGRPRFTSSEAQTGRRAHPFAAKRVADR
jgi:hypothetical protein